MGPHLWVLGAWVLKGLGHPQAFKGFFGGGVGVKLMSMYNKLKLCCLADFFLYLFFISYEVVGGVPRLALVTPICLEICN